MYIGLGDFIRLTSTNGIILHTDIMRNVYAPGPMFTNNFFLEEKPRKNI